MGVCLARPLAVTSSACPACPRLDATILLGVLADPEVLGPQAGCVLPPPRAPCACSSSFSPLHPTASISWSSYTSPFPPPSLPLLSVLLLFLFLLLFPIISFSPFRFPPLFPSSLSLSSLEECFFGQPHGSVHLILPFSTCFPVPASPVSPGP